MDFAKLFNLNYIFVQNPFPMHATQRNILIIIFAALVLSAIIALLWGRRQKTDIIAKKIASKIAACLFTLGAIGWIFFLMRRLHAYFFSRRFWFVFLFFGAIVWFFFLLKYIVKKAPTDRKSLQERREFEKYLPKKKK